VVPGDRHSGLGKRLMDHALKEIAKLSGTKASVAIINQNTRLKSWYEKYGFKETLVKKYDHLPFEVCFMEFVLPVAAEAE
jgi:ribosomal protein S18 acetylase RimI-like enzyme